MKKKIIAFAALVLCMTVFASSTLAYFTADDTATNVITTSKIEIELVETTDTGAEFKDLTGVMPGQEISKIVNVKNKQDARDAWVRICVSESVTLADGKEGDASVVKIPFNTTDWIAKADDNGTLWHYYRQRLKPGAETEKPLFEQVIFDKDAGNQYQEAEIVVDVYVQAVQAKNNGNSVLEARGWPNYITED